MIIRYVGLILLFLSVCNPVYSGGKLLATPGVSTLEGSGGGGIVPWAQLAGYATDDELSANAFCAKVNVKDFKMDSCGLQVNIYDQVELSYAEQDFLVQPLASTLHQKIFGVKAKLYGDLVYSDWPQISLGLQHKKLTTDAIAFALGAKKNSGTDYYLSASKLHLAAMAGYNFLWNATLRQTEANQTGLLGFGSQSNEYRYQFEWSSAILLNKSLAIGIEYRQKPDNLGLGEEDWKDVFIAWVPNKHVSITAAYVDLGSIAGIKNQTGAYLSITGYL